METFEELTVEDVGEWLEEKGFPSAVIDAFKGMCYSYTSLLLSFRMYVDLGSKFRDKAVIRISAAAAKARTCT